MHPVAQTNIQLFNQLRREGYSNEDLIRIHAAYQFTMQLFTGCFRPSGKTFIDHLVGTASILGSLRAPASLVAASLLHAAYVHGDFGTEEKGISDAKREQIREAVGEEIEQYVARYTSFPWNSKSMPETHDGIDGLGPMDRNVLLMRLANQLEDYLDLGILYCPNADSRKKSLHRRAPFVAEMAKKLGYHILAEELDKALQEITSTEIPVDLRNKFSQHRAYRILPKSFVGKHS